MSSSKPEREERLLDELRRAASAVYLAADEKVAAEISDLLQRAARALQASRQDADRWKSRSNQVAAELQAERERSEDYRKCNAVQVLELEKQQEDRKHLRGIIKAEQQQSDTLRARLRERYNNEQWRDAIDRAVRHGYKDVYSHARAYLDEHAKHGEGEG